MLYIYINIMSHKSSSAAGYNVIGIYIPITNLSDYINRMKNVHIYTNTNILRVMRMHTCIQI